MIPMAMAGSPQGITPSSPAHQGGGRRGIWGSWERGWMIGSRGSRWPRCRQIGIHLTGRNASVPCVHGGSPRDFALGTPGAPWAWLTQTWLSAAPADVLGEFAFSGQPRCVASLEAAGFPGTQMWMLLAVGGRVGGVAPCGSWRALGDCPFYWRNHSIRASSLGMSVGLNRHRVFWSPGVN